jgi:hypothetical protein
MAYYGRIGGRKARALISAAVLSALAGGAGAVERVRAVVLSGAAAPGNPAGVTFSQFGTPAINDMSQLVFSATLAGGSITTATDSGIFHASSANSLSRLVQEGSAAPGMAAGNVIANIDNKLPVVGGLQSQVVENGRIIVHAPYTVSGSTRQTVFLGTVSAALAPLVTPGQARPGGQGTLSSINSVAGNATGLIGLADQSAVASGTSSAGMRTLLANPTLGTTPLIVAHGLDRSTTSARSPIERRSRTTPQAYS